MRSPDSLHLRALSDAQRDFDEAGISRDYLHTVADLMDEFIERRQYLLKTGKTMRAPLPEIVSAPSLGQLLKEARGRKSQDQVAAAFRHSNDWISKIETGKLIPDKDTLDKLLDYYRVQDRDRFRVLLSNLLVSSKHSPQA